MSDKPKISNPLINPGRGLYSLSGFTLIELLIVIGIIVILAAIALPNYFNAREHSVDDETQANLRLIHAAEKVYRLEVGGYFGSNDIATLNTNLRLTLPAANSRNWDYITKATGCAQSTRHGGPNARTWALGVANMTTEEDPTASATCP